MARKLIAFLGNRVYDPTTYQWQGQPVSTSFFAQALCQFFSPIDTLYVFVTKEAKEITLPALQKLLANSQTTITPIDIPTGKDETGLWQIFQSCASVLEDGDEVIFDITHGFRSIPLLAFLASVYVRSIKNVELIGIYYGAYEAKSEAGITPVFDLTSFVRLLDWTVAVSHFGETGDARQLSDLLINTEKEIQAQALPEAPNSLQSLAELLDQLSTGLRVNRPIEVMQEAAHLDEKVKQARTEVERWAPPFALLLDEVNDTFGQFALQNPWESRYYEQHLTHTLAMIKWYVENRQYLQAYTVAREWMVTLAAFKVKANPLDERREIERLLGKFLKRKRKKEGAKAKTTATAAEKEKRKEKRKKWEESFHKLPKKAKIMDVWDDLSKQRNDLAHAGMNDKPTISEDVEEKAKKLPERLKELWSSTTVKKES